MCVCIYIYSEEREKSERAIEIVAEEVVSGVQLTFVVSSLD